MRTPFLEHAAETDMVSSLMGDGVGLRDGGDGENKSKVAKERVGDLSGP